MAPIQVLANNLLYDFSQTAIPTDEVDEGYLRGPRRWEIGNTTRFMIVIGPISSIFDYATFGTLLFAFGAWDDVALFQTGWFVESLLTQTLVIHIIRTAKIPFVESRASVELTVASVVVAAAGVTLPSTLIGRTLGFKSLPVGYWVAVAVILASDLALAYLAKAWLARRFGFD